DVHSKLIDAIAPRFKRNAGDESINENIDEINQTSYIIGGSTAQQGAYPWTVRLEVYYPGAPKARGVCGAVLWNKNHVVTAAHCIRNCKSGKQAEKIKVCIGDYDQNQNDGEMCYWANQWWPHPSYVYCNLNQLKNDIAVIKISNGMRVPYWGPNNVGNANFPWAPNNNTYEGTSTLTGWGQTNPSPYQYPKFPSKMKVVNLP
ncbi:trypsin-8-like protein, partial [Leptotrombidium deliense]